MMLCLISTIVGAIGGFVVAALLGANKKSGGFDGSILRQQLAESRANASQYYADAREWERRAKAGGK